MIGRWAPGGASRRKLRGQGVGSVQASAAWSRPGKGTGERQARAGAIAGPGAGGSPKSGTGETVRAGPARGARWLLLIIVAVGSAHLLFMLGVEGVRLVKAQLAISELERDVAQLELEAAELEAIIENGEDERYREQLARRQGYMYPDETRVVTSDPPLGQPQE